MKRKIIVCALSLGFFFLLASACRQDKGTFQTVSTDEFATAIARPEVQRVDVRTLLEYTEGHIPGSVNLNVLDEENFEACADSLLDKSQPVALYCRSGRRSKKAASLLSKRGYRVIELDKGFNDWVSTGREVEK